MLSRSLLAASTALALTLPAVAQEADTGGLLLRLGLSQRFEATENAALALNSEGRSATSQTGLALGLSSETRTDFIGLTLGAALRWQEAPGQDDDLDLTLQAPRATLTYTRSGYASRFDASISGQVEEVRWLRGLSDFLDEDGTLPDGVESVEELLDISDRDATGQRRNLSARTALRFGIDGPVEGGLQITASQVDYLDTDPTLFFDSRGFGVSGDMKLALTETLNLTGSAGYTLYDEEGSSERETLTMALGLALAQPRGSLSFNLTAGQIEEGTSYGFNTGWSTSFARGGKLALSLGASRSAKGTEALTGSLRYSQPLPRGKLSLQLRRGFTSGTEDEESLFTAAALGYSHELGPLTSLQMNLSYLDSEDINTGETTDRGDLNFSVSHQLPRDWALSAGYRRVMLRETSVSNGWAKSDSVYLSVERVFNHRF